MISRAYGFAIRRGVALFAKRIRAPIIYMQCD